MDSVIRLERFTLRIVTPEDHAAVLDVYRQCEDFLALGPNPTASAEMVAGDLALSQRQGGMFYGVLDPAGQMIGVVDVVPRLYEGDPALAFLELLMIARPYRSRGLGAEIVRVVEAAVRRDGTVKTIRAGVQVNNPGAIRFWQRMGYHITSGPTLEPDQTICYALRKDFAE
jgi:ribosomal protein S18 acetylase RimI-like enzyme